MDKIVTDWRNSNFVSCIKLNGKPIIPPLMTPERRAEMQKYKQLAVAVEVRLKDMGRKSCNDKRSSVDSGVTLLSNNEHIDHYSYPNRKIYVNLDCLNESRSVIIQDDAVENSEIIKNLVPCNGLGGTAFEPVTSDHLQLSGVSQQYNVEQRNNNKSPHIVQHDYESEMENTKHNDPVACLDQSNSCINNDLEVSEKSGVEYVKQSSDLDSSNCILSSNYTGYKVWEKICCVNNKIKDENALKPYHEDSDGKIVRSITVDSNNRNENSVKTSQQGWNNIPIHYSLVDRFITPVTENMRLNSKIFVSDTADFREKSDVSRIMSGDDKPYLLNNELQLVETLKETSLETKQNQKAEKLDLSKEDGPRLSEEMYASDNADMLVKMCEAVTDISKNFQSYTSGSDKCLKYSSRESNKKIGVNKLRHNSPESFGFPCSADSCCSTPHLLPHENLEDSVSSIALSASTDLNQYLNITGSSGSGSPGREIASSKTCECSEQDTRDSGNLATLQKLSSKASRSNLRMGSFSEPDLIARHTFLDDKTETQNCEQNFTDVKQSNGDGDKTNVIKKLVEHNDLSVTNVVEKLIEHNNISNSHQGNLATPSSEIVHSIPFVAVDCVKTSKNDVIHKADPPTCLTVPIVKLKLDGKSSAHISDLETFNSTASDTCRTENNAKKPSPAETPPKLVRQNSYTLDSPSPLLVAHMKTHNGKESVCDMTKNSYIAPKPCRKAWDFTQAKSRWESNSKKGNALLIVTNDKSVKKTNSSRCTSFARHNKNCNSSLPASNISSPIKIKTPFASLECLPLAVSKELIKSPTVTKHSTPRQNKKNLKDCISSAAVRADNSAFSYKKSTKHFTKNTSITNFPAPTQGSPKKVIDKGETPAQLNSHKDLRSLISMMQLEHSQQMALLLAKQRKEQEELREVFLRQQSEFLQEIKNVYPSAFSSPESQKLLKQQSLSPSTINEGNTAINPLSSVLSSRSLSLKSASMTDAEHDEHCKSIISCTNLGLNRTVKEQNVQPDAFLPKTPDSNNTKHLQFMNKLLEEVNKNQLQTSDTTLIPESNIMDVYLPLNLSSQSDNENTSNQLLIEQVYVQQNPLCSSEEINENKIPVKKCNINTSTLSATHETAVCTSEFTEIVNHSTEMRQVRSPAHSVCNPNNAEASNTLHMQKTCIRQLFPAHEEKQQMSFSEREKIAATRITAAVRGYLTRRVFRTARVQDLISTIRDTLLCAMQLNQECWPDITPEDVALHRRLIQQVTAACYSLHDVFFSLPIPEQMAIIAADRERSRNSTPRLPVPRPLSAATRKAIERKMLQNKIGSAPKRRPVSAGCSLHVLKDSGVNRHVRSGT
ncbi:uncharacterized protein Cp110 isoform X2 [Periplaneta americana]